jgi:hypothetical protein
MSATLRPTLSWDLDMHISCSIFECYLFTGAAILFFYKFISIGFMKNLLLFFLVIYSCADCFSQVIKGRILEINTNKPVDLASVYFNGTFLGTKSDQNGYFEIEIPKEYPYPLVISSIGYYSVTLRKFSADTSLLVYLTPKVYKLQEIVVKAHSRLEKRQRAKYLEIFRNQFLGETHNAEKCVITNEKDIKFKYDTSNNTLKAFCSQPLLINNYALGYSIKYYLDKFEYCEQEHSLVIIGNYIFKEESAKAEKLVTRMNREATYFGSRMHFLRSLYKNNADLDDYTIVDSSGYVLDYNQLVERSVDPDKPDDAYMIYTGDIYVIYKFSPDKGDWNRVSWLKVDTTVYFDKNGYFDPYPVIWWGDMARRRIGDLLPYEYRQK